MGTARAPDTLPLGSCWCRARHPSRGTGASVCRFIPTELYAETEMAEDLKGLKVLIVEDEWLVAMNLEAALEHAGIQVIGPVPTVQTALRTIEDEQLDAAFLNVNLGVEKVWPVADSLMDRGIPLVFVTSYDANNLPDRYRSLPYCTKPAAEQEAIRVLRKTISEQAAGEARA